MDIASELPPEESSTWDDYALILVDVQMDFWPEEVASSAPSFLDRTESLLRTCRNLGIEIIHVHARFQEDTSDWIALPPAGDDSVYRRH